MAALLLSVLCNIDSYQQARKKDRRVGRDKGRELNLVEERYPSNITLAKAGIKAGQKHFEFLRMLQLPVNWRWQRSELTPFTEHAEQQNVRKHGKF